MKRLDYYWRAERVLEGVYGAHDTRRVRLASVVVSAARRSRAAGRMKRYAVRWQVVVWIPYNGNPLSASGTTTVAACGEFDAASTSTARAFGEAEAWVMGELMREGGALWKKP